MRDTIDLVIRAPNRRPTSRCIPEAEAARNARLSRLEEERHRAMLRGDLEAVRVLSRRLAMRVVPREAGAGG